jgi:hypothetical protein
MGIISVGIDSPYGLYVKPANFNIYQYTTLQNDNYFNFTLPAKDAWYEVELLLSYTGNSDAGIKTAWDIGGTLQFETLRFITGLKFGSAEGVKMPRYAYNTASSFAASIVPLGIMEKFFISTTSLGTGTLSLQWAQYVEHGSTLTVNLGSTIKFTKIA